MGSRFSLIVILLLMPFAAQAQTRELLRPVGAGQAQRLEQYNAVFLLEALYTSRRHRIVSANTDLLLQDEALTITPFQDVEPIVIAPERVRASEDRVTWQGHITVNDSELEFLSVNYYTIMSSHRYDLNARGNAELSGMNRFKFSSAWIIGEDDVPVLRMPAQGVSESEVGPPPVTVEDIAEHKRLSELDRFAFASFRAKLELPNGKTYFVVPLRFTPRYSVVFEEDPEKVVPVPFETQDAAFLTDEQKAQIAQYEAFIRSLPIETDKDIRGDVE